MNTDLRKPPSPGFSDDNLTQLTTSGDNLDMADNRDDISLGHQGVRNTGGMNKNPNIRVLFLSGLDDSTNYKVIFEALKSFGVIERIKLLFKNYDYFVILPSKISQIPYMHKILSIVINYAFLGNLNCSMSQV